MEHRLRHRARQMLAALPDPQLGLIPWLRLLHARAVTERFWVHPGAASALQADARVSRSGADLLTDAGLSPTRNRLDLYVAHDGLAPVIKDYRLRTDPEGPVLVHCVPASVPRELAPASGEAVHSLVAAADLLDDDDPRGRAAAVRELGAAWAERMREARS
jgi:hypothetical protein